MGGLFCFVQGHEVAVRIEGKALVAVFGCVLLVVSARPVELVLLEVTVSTKCDQVLIVQGHQRVVDIVRRQMLYVMHLELACLAAAPAPVLITH